MESRLDALQHTFASWLKVMCTNFAQESQEISDVHFAKYYCLEDVGKCEAKVGKYIFVKPSPISLNFDIVLFQFFREIAI